METGKEPLSQELLDSLEKKYQIYLECPADTNGEIDFFLLLDKEEDSVPQQPQYSSSYVDNNFFINNQSTVNTKYSNPKYHVSPRRDDNISYNTNMNNISVRNSDLSTIVGTVNNSTQQISSSLGNVPKPYNSNTNANNNSNTTNSYYSFNNYGLNSNTVHNINSINNIASSPGYNAVKGYDYSRLNMNDEKVRLENLNNSNNNSFTISDATPERKSYFGGKKSKPFH
jgi:hypothetical protein